MCARMHSVCERVCVRVCTRTHAHTHTHKVKLNICSKHTLQLVTHNKKCNRQNKSVKIVRCEQVNTVCGLN